VLEVERKFTVPPDFVVPELAMHGWAVAPETTVVLDATYYDTEDLRLARAHITLRRRVGGSDAGWHLKLPAGRDRRRSNAHWVAARRCRPHWPISCSPTPEGSRWPRSRTSTRPAC